MAAFATVYLIWGSTYIGILFAIRTIPPFTMAAVRFLVAGAILYAWALARGAPHPGRLEWRGAAVVGALLFLGGNGAVVWAQQWVPSGLVALFVAVVPLWMVLIHWLWGGGGRPRALLFVGLLWGFAGVALLVGSEGVLSAGPRGLAGGLVVLAGSFCWALGSVAQPRLGLPDSRRMSTALQMITGGAWLGVAALGTGEAARLDLSAVSARSALAFLYLIFFGSLVAFSAYVFLLRVTTPARVSTYAYVNPVVALFLGWALAAEPLTPRTLLSAFVILTAVMLISTYGGSGARGAVRVPSPRAPPHG